MPIRHVFNILQAMHNGILLQCIFGWLIKKKTTTNDSDPKLWD